MNTPDPLHAEKPRDFETDPLTDYEKVVLTLAQYDLQYSRLQSAVTRLIRSKRPLSTCQSAVLTHDLEELAAVVAEEKPSWPRGAP